MEYYSNVKDNQLQTNVRKQIAKDLKQFEGKRVVIKIEKLKSTRSQQQNKYWWVMMTILSHDLGYTKEEMHEIAKFKFLKREKVDEHTGEIFEYLTSTTKLTKSEFADMTSEMIRWSAETFGIVIPLPNEQMEIE